ncbi:MAG TPA: hypothetical protein VJ873_05295 [bacterium]|nr:hypothetical protein [bacterium]
MGMDVFGKQPKNPQGHYFRSDVWSWRVIHRLCDEAIDASHLPFNTEKWARNDGHGLAAQEHCDLLADALEKQIERHPPNAKGIYAYELGALWEGGPAVPTGAHSEPDHQAHVDHIRRWILFLRNCGGFEIR